MREPVLLIAVTVWALAIIAYVGTDAARRQRNWLAWSGLTSLTGIIGLVAWLIVRRRVRTPTGIGFQHAAVILATAPLLLGISFAVTSFWITFVFQVARVEGVAMAPTLMDQDRIIVNKMAYRTSDPRVGDIVMHYYPNDPEKSFVKRVIAEEGDTLRIVDGRVYRNEVPIDDDYVPAEYRSHDDWGPEVIPEGYYFVMGDHRNNSSDSRHWKFVPTRYIVGRVAYRWWPLSEARGF